MTRNVSENLMNIILEAGKKVEPKSKAKNPGTKPRGGNRYMIVDETMIRPKLSTQAVFILKSLMDAGADGLTKKEIAELAEKAGQSEFPCTQPYDRAVGFYLSTFKNEGALAFAKASEDAA